eukprot:gene2980-3550_t
MEQRQPGMSNTTKGRVPLCPPLGTPVPPPATPWGLLGGGLCALSLAILFSNNYGARTTRDKLVAKSARLQQK